MKKWPTIIILASVLLILGGLATWDEWQTKKDAEAEKTKNRITEIKLDQIQAISYESKKSEESPAQPEGTKNPSVQEAVRLQMARVEGSWRIQSPVTTGGDQAAIESLVQAVLEYASAEEVGQHEAEWQKFGVKDPQRTITFQYKDSKTSELKSWTLYIGDKVPVGYSVYFRTSSSEKVFMGGQHILLSTVKTMFDLRDKRVSQINLESVTSFKYLVDNQEAVELSKKDANWTFIKPMGWELDPMDVKDYLGSINELKAAGFADAVSPDLAKGFDKPSFELRWGGDKQPAASLKFLEAGGKHWVKNDANVVMELADSEYKKMFRKPEDFRLKRIFGNTALDLVKIDIDGDKYQRRGALWYKQSDADRLDQEGKLKPDEKGEAPRDIGHIGTFAVDLEFLKTDRFLAASDVSVASYLTKPPQHTIQLEFKDTTQKAPLKVELFEAEDKNHFYVKRTGSDTIYRITKSAVANMSASTKNEATPQEEDEGLFHDKNGEDLPLPSEDPKDIDEEIKSQGAHSGIRGAHTCSTAV